ncbi:BMP family ABC transporter substrate-binding protein [Benzoatithermus flavus]|uniref:BMP family ABC transporter substrate-binding protein n=1 Tax=Benzoatithermus flavus TaxID=3108223 RepID=A0ABU8XPQ3_9PROT
MSLHLRRRSFVLGSAATGLGLAAGVRPVFSADAPLKVGFVYVGPATDNGWSYRHDVARKEVEAAFPGKVTTSFVENVPEGPDAERVIRQLASSGHGLIFTTSFGFMNPTLKVAKAFPKVKFEHATGYQTTPNVAVYNARFYEGRTVIGTIAGMMSKSGTIGYLGSFPIPEVVMGINAFTLAAQKINPNIKTKVVWVNSWHDPGKEADAAKTLIDQGCDILSQHTDSAAPLQVAEQRGVHGFGQAADQSAFAPKGQLTAIVDNWGPYYIERVKAVLDGTWKTHNIWHGLKEGMVSIAPYGPDVPEDVKAAAEKVKADIAAGTRHPFEGPIKDQKGQVRIPEGKHATDEELLKMDWYVEGVQA